MGKAAPASLFLGGGISFKDKPAIIKPRAQWPVIVLFKSVNSCAKDDFYAFL
jgi:hypothetical protein